MDDSDPSNRDSESPYPLFIEEEEDGVSREYMLDDNDSSADESSMLENLKLLSPIHRTSSSYLTSEPSSSNKRFVSGAIWENDHEEFEGGPLMNLTQESLNLPDHSYEDIQEHEEEGGEEESLDESDIAEDEESVVEEEPVEIVDFELEDNVSDDEDNFLGYCPTNIPPLMEEDMGEILEPIWKSFKKTIEKPLGSPQKPLSFQDKKPDTHTAEMSELQFNIETLFKTNLFMQMSIIDELSKLLTGNPAVVGGRSKMPEIEETLKEELPSIHTKMNDHLISCLEKDQNKLYLVELWWAWIEDLMPDLTPEYLKKFKINLIEKFKPKNICDDEPPVNHSNSMKRERAAELRNLGVQIHDLQTIEDDELPSDYEEEAGPIYYKKSESGSKAVNEDEEDGESEGEDSMHGKRKNPLTDSPLPAKRHRSDSNATKESEVPSLPPTLSSSRRISTLSRRSSKEGDVTPLPHTLTLSRRISNYSHRSSMSPPILSPAMKQSVPQTPVKDTSSIFSTPPVLLTNKQEHEAVVIKISKKKKPRKLIKKRSKQQKLFTLDLKFPYAREREIPNEDEEDPAIWQECGCDSDTIYSGETMKLPFIDTSPKPKDLQKQGRKESGEFGENESNEESAATNSGSPSPKLKRRKPRGKMLTNGLESEGVESSSSDDSLQGYSGLEEPCNTNERPQQTHRVFVYNGIQFDGEVLEKLIKAGIINMEENGTLIDTTENEHIFGGKKPKANDEDMDNNSKEIAAIQNQLTHLTRQTQQQSKIMYENLMHECERKQCLQQLGEMESTLTDNLEGPVGEADPEAIVESFKKLSMVYEAQGISPDKIEDLNIEHIATRALDLDSRFY